MTMAKKVGDGFGKTPGKNNSILGNPGAQGSVSFGGSYRQETSNVRPGKLPMKQTIANPKNAPVRTNGNAPGGARVCFDKGVKLPKPAKNRAGFTTSD
jgi:hypothetical protein